MGSYQQSTEDRHTDKISAYAGNNSKIFQCACAGSDPVSMGATDHLLFWATGFEFTSNRNPTYSFHGHNGLDKAVKSSLSL